MRRIALPWLGLTAGLIAAVAWPIGAQPSPEAPNVLDALRADYLEDERTGRRLADLHATLETLDGIVRLRLRVSAFGAHVDPAPGYRGVHGANHVTALDLTDLFERGKLKILVMPKRGTTKRFGDVHPGARARVPERRLTSSGALDLHAVSQESFLVDIECLTPDLPPGEHEVYLEAKGLPRLRVDVRVDGTGSAPAGAILDMVSLGGHEVSAR